MPFTEWKQEEKNRYIDKQEQHDREQITNFQKYHEKITATFQIEK